MHAIKVAVRYHYESMCDSIFIHIKLLNQISREKAKSGGSCGFNIWEHGNYSIIIMSQIASNRG